VSQRRDVAWNDGAFLERQHRAELARSGLVRLCAAGFVAYCSYAICRTPLLPLFASDLGAGPLAIGFVMGASTLTGVFLKLPAGGWSDILGRRPLLVSGALVFATLPFTYLGVSTLVALVILRFIHGSATAIFGPVATASLSDIAPPSKRATWLSTYSTAQGAGQALGPVLAGYLIAAGRFDLAFLAAGLLGIAAPLIVAGWRSGSTPPPRGARWQDFKAGIGEVARHRLVLVTSGAQAAQFVLNGTLNAFLPLYGRDVVGLTTRQLGWLFGMQTLTTLAIRPLIGFASDRAGRRWVIAAGLTACSTAVLAISGAADPWALAAAVVAYAAGVATTTAATSAYITDVSRRARYGAAHGVFGTIYDVGDALGPITAGFLVTTVGYARMFQITALVGFAMAAVFSVASRGGPVTDLRGDVTATKDPQRIRHE
ncbi:MAG TPA: MFS transporter, partial [Vicinamibacterales bacterium]|nr:MFS transporter [Vicinamibacterales bacterium]